MKNTFGSNLCLTIFGESHGRAMRITPPMPNTTAFRMPGAAATSRAGSLPAWWRGAALCWGPWSGPGSGL